MPEGSGETVIFCEASVIGMAGSAGAGSVLDSAAVPIQMINPRALTATIQERPKALQSTSQTALKGPKLHDR